MQLVPSAGLEPAASCSQSRRTTDCAMTTSQTSSGLSGSEEADSSWRWSRWGTYPSPATGFRYFYPHSLSGETALIDWQEISRLFRSSSCSMRFIFLVQKQAAPIDAAKRAADKYHGMMQSGYTMQASSHNGRTNPKTTTPILRNGTAARLMIDVFFKIMTSSLIFLRL